MRTTDVIFIDGDKLYLRSLEKKDIHINYIYWFNDQEVCQYNSHGYFPYTSIKIEEYLNYIDQADNIIALGIFNKANQEHIGNISLQQIDWISRSAEFAIIIGEKDYWKGGFGKEASDLMMFHGFSRLNLERIFCGTNEDNIGMQKLASYIGMIHEGTRRKAIFKNGKYCDIFEYGILKEEYMNTMKFKSLSIKMQK